ncbi:MAG: SDR family NAD(P)-dependent oxidoreductase [Kiritimatiellia bacterium]|nr:SDR family NAD(P)-dependent oxidoreductase [Kiritimatiellia bacterium]
MDKKVAIITGGASGIGRAIVDLFASEGASVLAVDRDIPNKAEFTGTEQIEFLKMDIKLKKSNEVMIDKAVQRYGALHILVNNAGVHGSGATPEEKWDDCIGINLRAAYLNALAAIPRMRESGGGTIVNIASVAGAVVGFASAHYDASKSGLVGLTRHLASRWGRDRIRVNAICPGFIKTPFIGKSWTKKRLGLLRRDIALGRLGSAEEIASVALFLASAESSYVTGTMIIADGGWTSHYVKY